MSMSDAELGYRVACRVASLRRKRLTSHLREFTEADVPVLRRLVEDSPGVDWTDGGVDARGWVHLFGMDRRSYRPVARSVDGSVVRPLRGPVESRVVPGSAVRFA